MRVAVTGTACVGKSTFINDFLSNWKDIFIAPERSYRDVLRESGLSHSKQTNKETQQVILDTMLEQHMKYTRDDNVIFDRCPLDNIAYSLYSYDKNLSDIDEDFIESCIPLVRECMKFIDIIFYIPYDPNIKIQDNGTRDTDLQYIKDVDAIFRQIEYQSLQPSSVFFSTNDRPAVIQISGEPRERIRQASLYVTDDGGTYEEGDSEIDWEELAKFNITPEDVFPGGKL